MAKSTKPADKKPTKPTSPGIVGTIDGVTGDAILPATDGGVLDSANAALTAAGREAFLMPEQMKGLTASAAPSKSSKPRGAEKTERRYFTVADNLRHDGEGLSAGDDVALNHAQFVALLPTGAIVKSEWSDGEIAD